VDRISKAESTEALFRRLAVVDLLFVVETLPGNCRWLNEYTTEQRADLKRERIIV
jgi:hypothetical protein